MTSISATQSTRSHGKGNSSHLRNRAISSREVSIARSDYHSCASQSWLQSVFGGKLPAPLLIPEGTWVRGHAHQARGGAHLPLAFSAASFSAFSISFCFFSSRRRSTSSFSFLMRSRSSFSRLSRSRSSAAAAKVDASALRLAMPEAPPPAFFASACFRLSASSLARLFLEAFAPFPIVGWCWEVGGSEQGRRW
eukprot:CAMPEP_0185543442 /NCGR_PEP_ID=MMETSP1381-20130426/3266_1 /TAXON_ID=298111 /ORGANISM="Pavlova sp., Strain CCMP459" /LENGTH=193 /DNA_ID=CAMNT_0028155543 /DNA_START=514 /DNA_END=1092 /DNA_ORIENTATION=-